MRALTISLCMAVLVTLAVKSHASSEAEYQDCMSIKEYFNDSHITCKEKRSETKKPKKSDKVPVETSNPNGEKIVRWSR